MKDDIFIAMIKEEINQYSHLLMFADRKEWIKNGNFEKFANKSLRQIRVLGFFVILSILIFSVLSVIQFIEYGNTGDVMSLSLGLASWVFVIFSTIYYTRNILQKKKSMVRILKLLEVRDDFFQSNSKQKEA